MAGESFWGDRVVRQVVLPPPPPAGAEALLLVFNASRGLPRRGFDPLPGAKVGGMRKLPNVLAFNLLTLQAEAFFKEGFPVQSQGEAAEVVEVVYSLEGGSDSVTYVLEGEPGDPTAWCEPADVSPGPTPAAEAVVTPVDIVMEATELVASLPDLPINACRRFFMRFDQETNPALLDARVPWIGDLAGTRKMQIERIRDELVYRLNTRAAEVKGGNAAPLFGVFKPNYVPDLGDISRLWIDLLVDTLGADPLVYEEAFELFASGALRLRLPTTNAWTTQPSSGWYFLFAEFALLVVENGAVPGVLGLGQPEVDFWLEMARVLIRTQPVFQRVYAPKDAGALATADLASYRSANFDPEAVWTPSELLALRPPLSVATPDQLRKAAATNAIAAFPGLW